MAFDYDAPAGVFTRGNGRMRGAAARYRRFPTAAEALRYAVEHVPASLHPAVVMEVDGEDFDHRAIRQLYDSPAFPLARESQA